MLNYLQWTFFKWTIKHEALCEWVFWVSMQYIIYREEPLFVFVGWSTFGSWFPLAPEILNQAEFVCYQCGRGLSATWAVDICRSVFTLLFDLLRKVVGPPCCSLGEETNIAETRIVQALFNNDRVVEGGGRGGGAQKKSCRIFFNLNSDCIYYLILSIHLCLFVWVTS